MVSSTSDVTSVRPPRSRSVSRIRDWRVKNELLKKKPPTWPEVFNSSGYWLLSIQLVIVNAIGNGFFFGNLGMILGSMGYDGEYRTTVVKYMSIANALGRVFCGFFLDYAFKAWGMSR